MQNENNKETNEIADDNKENRTGYINIALAYEQINKNNKENKTSLQSKNTR